MSYFERIIKSREEKSSHRQTLCKTSTGSSALNSARVRYHLLHSAGGDHPMLSSEIRVPMPASRKHVHDGECLQSTAISLPELTSISVETITQKLNDGDCT